MVRVASTVSPGRPREDKGAGGVAQTASSATPDAEALPAAAPGSEPSGLNPSQGQESNS